MPSSLLLIRFFAEDDAYATYYCAAYPADIILLITPMLLLFRRHAITLFLIRCFYAALLLLSLLICHYAALADTLMLFILFHTLYADISIIIIDAAPRCFRYLLCYADFFTLITPLLSCR